MLLSEIWRYPVKSLGGEKLQSSGTDAAGLIGDRRWGIKDVTTGYFLTARRAPELLMARARILENGGVEITLPDGSVSSGDRDLSMWLGRPIQLLEVSEERAVFESLVDFEHEERSAWKTWSGPDATFHDSGDVQLSLLAGGSLGGWDRRRFRANLVFDGDSEAGLLGQTIRVGTIEARVTAPIHRCVVVTRPQPGGIERDLDVLRVIARQRQGNLGVGATITRPGCCAAGDPITIVG